MKSTKAIIGCSAVLCLLLLVPRDVTTAPTPYDYDNVRDLYEFLLQREALVDPHRIVRKNNNRSPSLRLRFGRRSDPLMYQTEREAMLSDILSDN